MSQVAVTELTVALDVRPLLGTWRNTNAESRGIELIEIARAGDGVTVRAKAVHQWPAVEAQVYALETTDRTAQAFAACVDLGYVVVDLQANIKGGVLVVASFNAMKDGSPRSSYFFREFYYRAA
jgi:hypothetical protein